MIVAHGHQIYGHDPGSGIIAPGEPVVIDLTPRDLDSWCFADMTRTFVAGPPDDEIVVDHSLVREALWRATLAARPGVAASALYDLVCDLFESHGFATQRTTPPRAVATSGFFHGLGHGIGIEVHERPFLARSTDVLEEGDVIAIEPGLYRHGYGGCRLEDVVRVTPDGGKRLTRFPYRLGP